MPTAWTCAPDAIITIQQDCTVTASSTLPLYVQDSGNITFGLALIVFLLSMIFFGLVFNSTTYDY